MRMRRLLRFLLVLSSLGYVVFCALVAHDKERILYPNHGRERAVGRGAPAGYETWWLPVPATGQEPGSKGARAEAWWLPAERSSPSAPAPVVMYFHGNAELIDDQRQTAALWHSLGVSVLLCEHVGYGRSGGVPRLETDIALAAAWFDHLVARTDVRKDLVLSHGFSLGGAFAAQLAKRRPVAGLILESTFSSLPSMARGMGVWIYFPRERLDTAGVLLGLRTDIPVLLTHGRLDDVIPVSEGRRLAETRPGARYIEGDFPHVPWAQNEPDHALLRDLLVAAQARADKGLASPAAGSAP